MFDTADLPTAMEITAAISLGKTSAVEIVEACLERIARHDPVVRAFTRVDAEGARRVAAEADARRPSLGRLEPLHGVPMGFKDIVNTAGLATEYNSPIYAGHVPSVDAGIVPLAIGTQTSGSVIRPASYCGVHGFKGSWGEISYAGIKLTSASLDTVGLYARSLADIALFHSVLSATPPTPLVSGNVGGLRVGFYRSPFYDQAKPETEAALASVAQAIDQAGGTVKDFALPTHFRGLNDAIRWISAWEGARSLAWEKSFHRDRLSPELRDGRVTDGEACSPDLYRSCIRLAERCRIEFESVFDDLDVLLTPAAPGEAPAGIKETGSAVFNMAWTALHVPCVTLPGHVGPKGLPVGVQLIGKRGADRQLLEMANWIERVALR